MLNDWHAQSVTKDETIKISCGLEHTHGLLGLELSHCQWPLTSLLQRLCWWTLFWNSSPSPSGLSLDSPAFLRAVVCIIYSVFSVWSLMGHFSRFSLHPLISLILPSILCTEVLSSHQLLPKPCVQCKCFFWSISNRNSDSLLLLTSLFRLLFVCLHSVTGWKQTRQICCHPWEPLVLCKAPAVGPVRMALIGLIIYLIPIDILFVTKM